jgi:hypothetical protein
MIYAAIAIPWIILTVVATISFRHIYLRWVSRSRAERALHRAWCIVAAAAERAVR